MCHVPVLLRFASLLLGLVFVPLVAGLGGKSVLFLAAEV
jgi:hypothetical protein